MKHTREGSEIRRQVFSHRPGWWPQASISAASLRESAAAAAQCWAVAGWQLRSRWRMEEVSRQPWRAEQSSVTTCEPEQDEEE